jgi:hypothetical protein
MTDGGAYLITYVVIMAAFAVVLYLAGGLIAVGIGLLGVVLAAALIGVWILWAGAEREVTNAEP